MAAITTQTADTTATIEAAIVATITTVHDPTADRTTTAATAATTVVHAQVTAVRRSRETSRGRREQEMTSPRARRHQTAAAEPARLKAGPTTETRRSTGRPKGTIATAVRIAT